MAVSQTEQKLIDTTKRAVIKLTGIANSTGDLANTTLIDVSNLAYALNANGQIMASNTHPLPYYGVSISRISGYVKSQGYLKLQWKSNTNSEIVVVGGTGSFEFPIDSAGQGVPISNPNDPTTDANTNGDILISSYGIAANDVYTLIVDIKKNNQYYDAGQTRDPVAFNLGPARM